jgi:hypothetical protein
LESALITGPEMITFWSKYLVPVYLLPVCISSISGFLKIDSGPGFREILNAGFEIAGKRIFDSQID